MQQRTLAWMAGGLLVVAVALAGATAALAWGPNPQTPPGSGSAGPGYSGPGQGGFGPGGMMGGSRGVGPAGMMGGWGTDPGPSTGVTGTVPYGPGGMMEGRGAGAGGMMGGWAPGAGISGTVPYGPGGMMGGWSSGNGITGTVPFGPGGMMGGRGVGPGGMMGGWGQGSPSGQPITVEQARQNLQAYVDRLGNADLTIGEVMEFSNNYYAIVEEKSTGTGAIELLVDKSTGAVFPEYGPAMMWNTKYGMMAQNPWMGQMMGWQQPTGPMTVSAEQAKQIAQQWLDQAQPGTTTEAPDVFPGYYTLHTLKDGKVSGMLSVNGYTGQVWYHSWHGPAAATPKAQS